MRITRALTAIAVGIAITLTGCGDDEPTNQTHTAANGDKFNDADVAFVSEMIQHHAQALSMVDLTIDRNLDPEVAQRAEEIRMAQAPEIERMAAWLNAWGEPVPETMRDHTNAHKGGHMEMGDMPGMMSADDMSALENASSREFQSMWLQMMIEHHEGAIAMAQTEQDDGQNAAAVALAAQIEAAQSREIDQMQAMLGR